VHKHGINPVEAFAETLKAVWKPAVVRDVTFPIFIKLGIVNA
jgi:hypothetical protein